MGVCMDLQKQKQYEKRSGITEESLNGLSLSKKNLDEWMKFADSCLVFSRDSQANRQRFESLDKDEQRTFLEECDKDPYELNNYLKSGISIFDELISAISKGVCLQDHSMVEQLEELPKKFRTLLGGIAAKHFPGADSAMRLRGIKDIQESQQQINDLYRLILKAGSRPFDAE